MNNRTSLATIHKGATTVFIGPSVPLQYRVSTIFSGFDAPSFLIPTTTTTIGVDEGGNARDRIGAFRRIAAGWYDNDAATMLNDFLSEGAGAADVAFIARHVSNDVVVAQPLRKLLIDIEALENDDDRHSYLRFSNDPGAAIAFDNESIPSEQVLACIPIRHADDVVFIVYPDGSRRRAPIARQALYLLIDALGAYEPLFLDRVYVTAAKREAVPESIGAAIEVRILKGYDVSRTTGRVFDWDAAPPDDFPIGLATDATVAVVREDGSEIVEVPMTGNVVLPLHGEDDEDATFPSANIVSSLLDIRHPQPKRFAVFSDGITDRMAAAARGTDAEESDALQLSAAIAHAFADGIAPMLIRVDEEDEWWRRRSLLSGDVIVDFPAALPAMHGWKISSDAIGRLAQAIIRHRKSNVALCITPSESLENVWLIYSDRNVGERSIVILE